ncbi:MAG: HNH endonuclease [Acidimicrobiia bacterium]
MEWECFSTDHLEGLLSSDQQLIDRLRARQLMVLEVLDSRQVATGDGFRSLSDWTAARLDVGKDTAKSLVRTMRRTVGRPELREALVSGVSFDRVEALSRIPVDVGLLEHLDVSGVQREAARRAGVSADAEFRSADDRFLVLQPSLDESWWKLWGGLDAHAGAMVDKVLSGMADQLPELPDGSTGDSSWRKATALFELCVSEDPVPAHVTVFVDATHAVGTNGETGVILEAGPIMAREALQAVICDSVTEVIARTADGRYMDYGRKHRVVPPSLRRALIDRYLGVCAADGCDSRHRIQAHHRIPWSDGGRTDQDNLILLCWYHHQVVVHEQGFQIYQHPDHGRIRFRQPTSGRSP